ncbi:molybdopterin cofactor-binding domain-containing protein [Sphingomonas sp. 3-13AW]|uniref:xanthine dehydrogenase family protein molybdopterin-binding subunit n=1 Tax=Sphingomonas sp. 3-13AW TaxID=3050450 RepID=UPI003BB72629
MALDAASPGAASGAGLTRRRLLVGGAAGVGLVVAFALWPREYAVNLAAAEGETIFGPWLKIGTDGQVTVAVPQAEMGQGVFTALAQIVADELGADWQTVAVEPAPINPLYANRLAASILFEDALGDLPEPVRGRHVQAGTLMLTAASTSVRAFEEDLRQAGAAARILLCKAAARRWDADWQSCATVDGFVVMGSQRERFGTLAADAVGEELPSGTLPLRTGDEKRLTGQPLPRLDAPAKVDGSANFAGDIRLPGMVFAALRQGPIGDSRLVRVDRAAAERVRGVSAVIENPNWVAAVGETWWAANRALDALAPRFETRGRLVDSASIDAALDAALDGDGNRMTAVGDLAATFKDAEVVTADYRVGAALHAAIEPTTATAVWRDGQLSLWMPTQAPALARAAAARTLGISQDRVVLHPTIAGGSFGANLEHQVAEQAALLARRLEKPVQLTWSRSETCLQDRYRPPAAARLTARLGKNGAVAGWLCKIAAPPVGNALSHRLLAGDAAARAAMLLPRGGDKLAVEGAVPAYAIPALAVDHHSADVGVPVGYWRSGAHSYTSFFNECFIDELAHVAGIEAHSFRISMLGGNPRLARCLSTVATLGGWQGGIPGSAQGLACHHMRGSYIAVLAEARMGPDQRIKVERLVAAVDCGRQINPDLVLQQIEGGLMFGMAAALGASTCFTDNLADVRGFGQMRLPRLADTPEISVEVIRSDADPGGVSELAVPPVAPAIANAIMAATGVRIRRLPLLPEDA